MLIILEGPDLAGKSTLAKSLADEVQALHPGDTVEIMHKGPPTEHPLDEYEAPLFDYRPYSGRHIICDRWHLGEVIYPGVLGRASSMDEEMLWHIELFLLSRGALLVHVTAKEATLQARHENLGDELVDNRQLHRVRVAYHGVFETTVIPHLCVLTDHSLHSSVGAIVLRAKALEMLTTGLSQFTTYVGPRFPDVLLLGDKRGMLQNLSVNAPAFMPYATTSGHYLLKSLLTRGPRLVYTGQVGIANACDVDDPMTMWARMTRPHVVALGVQAHDKVREFLDAPHVVDHPQYVRRFHHSKANEYAAHIMRRTTPSWR